MNPTMQNVLPLGEEPTLAAATKKKGAPVPTGKRVSQTALTNYSVIKRLTERMHRMSHVRYVLWLIALDRELWPSSGLWQRDHAW